MTIQNTTVTQKSKAKEIQYEILEDCGSLGTEKIYVKRDKKSYDGEIRLRLLSFNGGDAKYDIRPWYTDDNGNEQMSKGVRLSGEQLQSLKDLLNAD